MKDFPVALQLYSVRDDSAKDFFGTLEKVKEMGYDGVEFAGLHGKTAKEVKEKCAELGLTPISAHIAFGELLKPDVIETYAEVGCKFVVIPHISKEYRVSGELFNKFVEGVKTISDKAKSLGMTLAYHNHDFEFNKVDGKYELDIMYETIPADQLEAQLDTCWVNVGGENPVDYINKYAGRLNILHLKDFVGSKSENMYELIGIDEGQVKEKAKAFEFRPIGKGVQDFPAILEAAKKAGTKWVVVEQDAPSMELSMMECAKESITYLKSL